MFEQRIQTIISCSKIYDDGKHVELENLMDNENIELTCHKSCVSMYTDKNKANAFEKRKRDNKDSGEEQPIKVLRSSLPKFDFRKQCLYCGTECVVIKDKKNPSRWRPAYMIREKPIDDEKTMKQRILDVCKEKNDKWSTSVRVRVEGPVSDLNATDGRYHMDCRNKFHRSSLTNSKKLNDANPDDEEKAFSVIVDCLKSDETKVWNLIELFKLYTKNGGFCFNRKKNLLDALKDKFRSELIILSSKS